MTITNNNNNNNNSENVRLNNEVPFSETFSLYAHPEEVGTRLWCTEKKKFQGPAISKWSQLCQVFFSTILPHFFFAYL